MLDVLCTARYIRLSEEIYITKDKPDTRNYPFKNVASNVYYVLDDEFRLLHTLFSKYVPSKSSLELGRDLYVHVVVSGVPNIVVDYLKNYFCLGRNYFYGIDLIMQQHGVADPHMTILFYSK